MQAAVLVPMINLKHKIKYQFIIPVPRRLTRYKQTQTNGNPLQCSCLENPMDRGAWYTTVHRIYDLPPVLDDLV